MNVEGMLRAFCDAVERRDGKSFAALFSEDGVYHDVFYGTFAGRTEIAAMIDDYFYRTATNFRWDMHEPVSDGTTLYARYIQARKIIAKDGLLAIGSSGQFVEHPAVKIERNSMKMFLTAAEQYGIGPVARTRLGLADLHRRNMAAELERALGGGESAPPPDLDLPEAEVVEDDDVGLPV